MERLDCFMDQQPHSKELLKCLFFLFFQVGTEQLFDRPSLHTFLINASAILLGELLFLMAATHRDGF